MVFSFFSCLLVALKKFQLLPLQIATLGLLKDLSMTSFCHLFLLLLVSPHIHGILVAYLMNSNSEIAKEPIFVLVLPSSCHTQQIPIAYVTNSNSRIAKGLGFDIFHVYCVLFQDVKGKVFTCTNCNFLLWIAHLEKEGGFVCPVLLINVTLIIYLICILAAKLATSFMEKSFYLHFFWESAYLNPFWNFRVFFIGEVLILRDFLIWGHACEGGSPSRWCWILQEVVIPFRKNCGIFLGIWSLWKIPGTLQGSQGYNAEGMGGPDSASEPTLEIHLIKFPRFLLVIV